MNRRLAGGEMVNPRLSMHHVLVRAEEWEPGLARIDKQRHILRPALQVEASALRLFERRGHQAVVGDGVHELVGVDGPIPPQPPRSATGGPSPRRPHRVTPGGTSRAAPPGSRRPARCPGAAPRCRHGETRHDTTPGSPPRSCSRWSRRHAGARSAPLRRRPTGHSPVVDPPCCRSPCCRSALLSIPPVADPPWDT